MDMDKITEIVICDLKEDNERIKRALLHTNKGVNNSKFAIVCLAIATAILEYRTYKMGNKLMEIEKENADRSE